MAIFFITFLGRAVLCVAPAIQCVEIPFQAMNFIIAGGSIEIAVELIGVFKVYREKNKDKDNEE
jgi:hypothetical protein